MARIITGTIYKRGSTYWLKYIVNGVRVRKSLDTGDEKEAKKRRTWEIAQLAVPDAATKAHALALRAADTETQLAATVEAVRPRLAIADAWQKYTAAPNRPQSGAVTLEDFRQRWEKFADWMKKNHADAIAMEDVTPELAEEFTGTLSALSPNRYNKIIQTCRLVFRILSRQLKNFSNPFEGISCKGMNTRSHRELSVAELRDVCSAATGELRTLFAIGLYTALRLGDCATLRWEEVSIPLNRITRKNRKTGKITAIPLHPTLRAILEETPEANRRDYVLPDSATTYLRDKAALSKRVQKHFDKKCKIVTQAKHDEKSRRTCEVGFHSLRHSFVTICATAGVPLAVVQALCGHGSPAIQAKYVHIGHDAAALAVGAMPRIGEPPDPDKEKADAIRKRLEKLLAGASLDMLEKIEKAAEELANPKPAVLPAGKAAKAAKKGKVQA